MKENVTEVDAGSVFEKCKWIWAEQNDKKNDWVIFRRKFTIEEKPPKSAVVRIAAVDKYNLYMNNKLVVFDGGLERESAAKGGYYDELDVGKYLVKGDNVFVIVCHYLGMGGANSISSAPAGLLFECKDFDIVSDESFTVFRSDAYSDTKGDKPSGFYAAYNLRYDITKEGQLEGVYGAQYGSNIFVPATVHGKYPEDKFGRVTKRPIPLYDFTAPIKAKKLVRESLPSGGELVTADLGQYCCFVPVIDVNAASGQAEIEIFSDRYECLDTGSTTSKSYRNQRIEYVCKEGPQNFTSPIFLTGTQIMIRLPQTVKLSGVSYIKTGYDFSSEALEGNTGGFALGISDLEVLGDKAVVTVENCMRGTFYSTPERERAMFAGNLSAMAWISAYAMTDTAQLLTKKCIEDYIAFARASVLRSCVPGISPVEIPSQNLLAIGERGFIAAYYDRTGDSETLKKCIKPMAEYLMLFEKSSDGLIVSRKGDNAWYDNGENIDIKLLENAIYYSALKFLKRACEETGIRVCDGFIKERMKEIGAAYEGFYKNGGYTSKTFFDDRANAWAVLSGLAKKEHYPQLIKLLACVNNASPYMENYVIDALMKMGAVKEGVMRMRARYFAFADADYPTLPEDFFTGASLYAGGKDGAANLYNPSGSLCYGSTGGVVANVYRYLAGVTYKSGERVEIRPNVNQTGSLSYTVTANGGDISGTYKIAREKCEVVIVNRSAAEVYLIRGDEETKLNKGKNKFSFAVT